MDLRIELAYDYGEGKKPMYDGVINEGKYQQLVRNLINKYPYPF